MNAQLYIEGAESKEDQIRCREGFRKLLEKLGYAQQRRMPRLTACGSRNSTFDDYTTALASAKPGRFVAMLIDSETPVSDLEQTWAHLREHDHWNEPAGGSDEQVLMRCDLRCSIRELVGLGRIVMKGWRRCWVR